MGFSRSWFYEEGWADTLTETHWRRGLEPGRGRRSQAPSAPTPPVIPLHDIVLYDGLVQI